MKRAPTIIGQDYHFKELSMTDSNDNEQTRPSGSGGRLGLWRQEENGTQERTSITHNRADHLGQSEFGICWLHPPDEAWSPGFYLSERGLDNIHIYFWITKDFCWVQSLLIPGLIIGSIAVLYALFLSFRALYWRKNIGEFWIKFSEFLWLFANFWWMVSDLARRDMF